MKGVPCTPSPIYAPASAFAVDDQTIYVADSSSRTSTQTIRLIPK